MYAARDPATCSSVQVSTWQFNSLYSVRCQEDDKPQWSSGRGKVVADLPTIDLDLGGPRIDVALPVDYRFDTPIAFNRHRIGDTSRKQHFLACKESRIHPKLRQEAWAKCCNLRKQECKMDSGSHLSAGRASSGICRI